MLKVQGLLPKDCEDIHGDAEYDDEDADVVDVSWESFAIERYINPELRESQWGPLAQKN